MTNINTKPFFATAEKEVPLRVYGPGVRVLIRTKSGSLIGPVPDNVYRIGGLLEFNGRGPCPPINRECLNEGSVASHPRIVQLIGDSLVWAEMPNEEPIPEECLGCIATTIAEL